MKTQTKHAIQIPALTFILFIILFHSCIKTNDTVVNIDDTDFKEYISLNEVQVSTSELLNIRKILIVDSFLIINNSREDSLFMAFDLKNFQCIKSWGSRGNGPGEHGLFTHLIGVSSNSFQIADFSKYRLETYSLPAFILIKEESISQIPERGQYREIPQTIVSPDGEQFFYDCIVNHELLLSKWQKGDSSSVINSFDSFKKSYNSSSFYTGTLILNNELNRLVYAYHYLRRFDIMDFNGNIIKTFNIKPSPPEPVENGNNIDLERTIICYVDAKPNDSSFFLYYVGQPGNSLYKEHKSYIEQYDWNGKPLARYEINRPISEFELINSPGEPVSFIGVDESSEEPLVFFRQ